MKKIVSIYIPTYNRCQLLDRAIKSVINQTYNHIEIVVCSDNSTDKTDELMKEYTEKYSFIKYVKNEINSGACATRNRAISHCTGYYITGLDDDDYFSEERISNFISLINDENNIYFSNLIIKEKNGFKKYTQKKHVNYSEIIKRNSIGNQVFCKKEIMCDFDVNLSMWQDKECWIRLISKNGTAINTNKYDYFLDLSHEHERISKGCSEKIIKTIALINSKYNKASILDYLTVSGMGYASFNENMEFKKYFNLFLGVDNEAKITIIRCFLKRIKSFLNKIIIV